MLKRCPKCSGSVRIDRDEYGWFEQCIMCGYLRDLREVVVSRQEKAGALSREAKSSRAR